VSGHAAALPAAGWQPAERRQGCLVLFTSEDGTQRQRFDFSRLACDQGVSGELAAAFEAVTGPLGTCKRLASARNLFYAAQCTARWISQARPGMTSLGQLTGADARMLARSFTSRQALEGSRALLGRCDCVSTEAREELARHRVTRASGARQPYTAAELARITTVARAIARRARERIRDRRGLLASYRDGLLDDLPAGDGRRLLAEVLDYCDRAGDVPRKPSGAPLRAVAEAARYAIGGEAADRELCGVMMPQLHLNIAEAWAFAVLLAALTGLNASVIDTLPAPALRATAEGEQPVTLVATSKHRRGNRARVTLPLDALPAQLRAAARDGASRVPATSLNGAAGVFGLLVELTEPARRHLRGSRALVYVSPQKDAWTGSYFKEGIPLYLGRQRVFTRPWLTGDPAADELLEGIGFDRLRKTKIESGRRPVAHTPATYAAYLRKMGTVTAEGFQIVRDALDGEVRRALARREMTTVPDPAPGEDDDPDRDTVLGSCSDFASSPRDGGCPCRQTFLDCLDCTNARALPRHLPFQMAVADEIAAMRAAMTADAWTARYAGRAAQLAAIADEFEPAQVEAARAGVTSAHRQLAARLLAGDLDPS
jgi:hypothetical protein